MVLSSLGVNGNYRVKGCTLAMWDYIIGLGSGIRWCKGFIEFCGEFESLENIRITYISVDLRRYVTRLSTSI